MDESHYSYHGDDIKKMALSSLFAALIAVGAYLKIPIPFSPVPITLQVLFIFLAGAMLGARWGTLSVIVYLLLGIIGLPVFSGGSSGIGMLLGPTGGYLISFAIAAFLIGTLSEKKGTSNILLNATFMIAGLCVIYLLGTSYLSYAASITLENAVKVGVLPFLPADLLKLALASVIVSKYSI
ncbi:biotin transporter BioY [Methanolobus halotolerans]|uniref:BioY family transporter n=1 Tax=Methanolobus halotolerans TaxID=2052935 RepID=A0A4E0QTG7_9EURY|nr:biotin transporter BioY [Methanolobus halotolerans]TGC11131.1 BioY family transporter [Methanolobus halotolerans]